MIVEISGGGFGFSGSCIRTASIRRFGSEPRGSHWTLEEPGSLLEYKELIKAF